MIKNFLSLTSRLLICLCLLFATNAIAQIPQISRTPQVAEEEKIKLPNISAVVNKNLIINGNAEAGEAAWRGEGFESARYGTFGDEWEVGVTGAPNGGDSYFRLTVAEGKDSALAKQLMDLSKIGELFDKNPLEITLSGYIGGTPTKEEKFAIISLTANFLDKDKKPLGSTSIEVKEKELPKAEVGSSSMVLQTKTSKFPSGTRVIELVLKVKNACLTCTSIGYADNISVVFKQVK